MPYSDSLQYLINHSRLLVLVLFFFFSCCCSCACISTSPNVSSPLYTTKWRSRVEIK
ncbi:hypothetical protein POPTR_002G159350v4 [Populus trichocarpa]|uniref:Uncharacterized protein n=1 Tax=Populus trichocarpa TaxID=3694 RepID=A0ACC0TFD3_POPTR|nr:hypothetical protein POPTR_002G159350v4 [Populus trichocarpa]